MNNPRQALRQRIQSGPTFFMAGAHDALSALVVEQSDFDGIFTTGFGISASLLGRPDVELYTLTENVGVVRRITDLVTKPVFADADTGYGNVINVQRTVREFENAGVAALSLEDQFSPKRCPAAAAKMPLISASDAVAKIRAAVDARRDRNLIIVARTDAVDPNEAMDRAAQYAEAGADLIQPISRTYKSYAELVKLREVCGRRLSLQLMQGTWMEALTREQIESVAALATYPIVTLMTALTAMQQNLAVLAARRTGQVDAMPCPQSTMPEFKKFIGFEAIEALQAHYEMGSR
ncbi:MAG: carboxyvinyl-carboxyphosphonate phosphorylmutase [Burkholderiales bacterium PBB5]|nr:MAG: carboxyvinyl-carboxyphosphonate phosphorylmutase [Burkholderiales bacterium PBB5]